MERDHYLAIIGILIIIAIAAFGGVKNPHRGLFYPGDPIKQPQKSQIEEKIKEVERQIKNLETEKNKSVFSEKVSIGYVNRSTDPSQEYITIQMKGQVPEQIYLTGWTVKSTSSGASVTIPKATYLFFTGMLNSEENIYLENGDIMYLVTGLSPNGASFKLNKCSGYLEQFQNFVPYINSNCPLPRNEDLSSIPNRVINDACFDYIDSFPSCRIETNTLPANWSHECTTFISTKINYGSCINTHKGDSDFYQHEWRVYLRRNASLWKMNRENIVLYDNLGKIVDSITY